MGKLVHPAQNSPTLPARRNAKVERLGLSELWCRQHFMWNRNPQRTLGPPFDSKSDHGLVPPIDVVLQSVQAESEFHWRLILNMEILRNWISTDTVYIVQNNFGRVMCISCCCQVMAKYGKLSCIQLLWSPLNGTMLHQFCRSLLQIVCQIQFTIDIQTITCVTCSGHNNKIGCIFPAFVDTLWIGKKSRHSTSTVSGKIRKQGQLPKVLHYKGREGRVQSL